MYKNYFLLLLLYSPFFLKAQSNKIVYIPDTNFKCYLVKNASINTNRDSEIQVSEAEAFTGGIHLRARKISNLQGIEAFINLTTLDCSSNNLMGIDISMNTTLKLLFCYNNQLTNLDVTKNTSLEFLSCYDNKLTSLDVSMNDNLWYFDCSGNQLKSIDVSMNPELTDLECHNNQLTSLNVKNGNNSNMIFFNASNNENLTCIQVDDENTMLPICNVISYEGWCEDRTANYSENCVTSTNIEDPIFSASVSVFPNPVVDKLTIKHSAADTLKSVRLYSANKEKVLETKGHTVDFSNLHGNNLYGKTFFLEIENTKNKIATKKIIKN